mgnify:CR=1 FL=1
MPYKAMKPCGYPGCPKLTPAQFCEEHAKAEARRYNRYERDPASKKRYGYQWQKVRARFLAAHPLCAECLANGITTPASEVHHILPLSRGGTHDEENLMPVCKSCHSGISARDGDRWGPR